MRTPLSPIHLWASLTLQLEQPSGCSITIIIQMMNNHLCCQSTNMSDHRNNGPEASSPSRSRFCVQLSTRMRNSMLHFIGEFIYLYIHRRQMFLRIAAISHCHWKIFTRCEFVCIAQQWQQQVKLSAHLNANSMLLLKINAVANELAWWRHLKPK